jgi:hypothetical protein
LSRKKNTHISIDYVVRFFSPRLRAATEVALGVLICACLGTLLVVSLPMIVCQRIRELGPNGGFVFDQIHNIQPGCRPETFYGCSTRF